MKNLHEVISEWREAKAIGPGIARATAEAKFRNFVATADRDEIRHLLDAIEQRGYVSVSDRRTA